MESTEGRDQASLANNTDICEASDLANNTDFCEASRCSAWCEVMPPTQPRSLMSPLHCVPNDLDRYLHETYRESQIHAIERAVEETIATS